MRRSISYVLTSWTITTKCSLYRLPRSCCVDTCPPYQNRFLICENGHFSILEGIENVLGFGANLPFRSLRVLLRPCSWLWPDFGEYPWIDQNRDMGQRCPSELPFSDYFCPHSWLNFIPELYKILPVASQVLGRVRQDKPGRIVYPWRTGTRGWK